MWSTSLPFHRVGRPKICPASVISTGRCISIAFSNVTQWLQNMESNYQANLNASSRKGMHSDVVVERLRVVSNWQVHLREAISAHLLTSYQSDWRREPSRVQCIDCWVRLPHALGYRYTHTRIDVTYSSTARWPRGCSHSVPKSTGDHESGLGLQLFPIRGWMRVEPQQRNAHAREDQSGSMNLPTFGRGESQTSSLLVCAKSSTANHPGSLYFTLRAMFCVYSSATH